MTELLERNTIKRVSFKTDLLEERSGFSKSFILSKLGNSSIESSSFANNNSPQEPSLDKVRSYYKTIHRFGSFDGSRSLRQKGYSSGLIKSVCELAHHCPVQINCDNSGFSMIDNFEYITSTKWTEEDENEDSITAVQPPKFSVNCKSWYPVNTQVGPHSEKGDALDNDWSAITAHVKAIYEQLVDLKESLDRNDRTVLIIVNITDLPIPKKVESNEEMELDEIQLFLDALNLLETLPINIVVHVSENLDSLYHKITSQVEKTKVMRCYFSEAAEVHKYQKWLNYGDLIHKCRKLGCSSEVLDALGTRKLSISEMKNFCEFLFDDNSLPDPTEDWGAFMEAIKLAIRYEHEQWNPIKRKVMPWIDIKKLKREYATKRT